MLISYANFKYHVQRKVFYLLYRVNIPIIFPLKTTNGNKSHLRKAKTSLRNFSNIEISSDTVDGFGFG